MLQEASGLLIPKPLWREVTLLYKLGGLWAFLTGCLEFYFIAPVKPFIHLQFCFQIFIAIDCFTILLVLVNLCLFGTMSLLVLLGFREGVEAMRAFVL